MDENVVFKMVRIGNKKCVTRLWEHMKNQFTDLKTTIMDAIMDRYHSNASDTGRNQMDHGIIDSGRSIYKSGDFAQRSVGLYAK